MQAANALMVNVIGSLRVGDAVGIKGGRVVGTVTKLDANNGHGRVVFKVTAVLGKSSGSKAARAWQGAWVTCGPEMVDPLASQPN
jgi:hypothetical protein